MESLEFCKAVKSWTIEQYGLSSTVKHRKLITTQEIWPYLVGTEPEQATALHAFQPRSPDVAECEIEALNNTLCLHYLLSLLIQTHTEWPSHSHCGPALNITWAVNKLRSPNPPCTGIMSHNGEIRHRRGARIFHWKRTAWVICEVHSIERMFNRISNLMMWHH